jgi:hypothetical protein
LKFREIQLEIVAEVIRLNKSLVVLSLRSYSDAGSRDKIRGIGIKALVEAIIECGVMKRLYLGWHSFGVIPSLS